ncbi:MAG: cupin domain-containing protein [Oceanospirillaceae bacterium]|nr:cupin domain-containing protein [Oceanospirillaceae bacterium]
MIAVNGDLSRRVHLCSDEMDWVPSPGGEVLRKRLHLVGTPEGGEVTSLVRYPPGAVFPPHPHPGGEEILVLEGLFSDAGGDWPAGSYLLNPEGFEHAPSSEPGCLLFVKLRQYPGSRRQWALDTGAMDWQTGTLPGVELKWLYRDDGYPETMRLERWAPGTLPEPRAYPGGVEVLVLEGSFNDEQAEYGRYDWLRLPAGASHRPASRDGCVLYIKENGLGGLTAG